MCSVHAYLTNFKDFVKATFLCEFVYMSAVECIRDRTTIMLSFGNLRPIWYIKSQ